MKRILFVALFVLSITPAHAQWSGALRTSFDVRTWDNRTPSVFGISANAYYELTENLDLAFSLGFLKYTVYDDRSMIPIQAGARFYFTRGIASPYVSGDIGAAIASGTQRTYDLLAAGSNNQGGYYSAAQLVGSSRVNSLAFTYTLGFGTLIALTDAVQLDLGGNLLNVNSFPPAQVYRNYALTAQEVSESFLTLNLGLRFGF